MLPSPHGVYCLGLRANWVHQQTLELLDRWVVVLHLVQRSNVKNKYLQFGSVPRTLRYDTIEEINVDSKAEYTA